MHLVKFLWERIGKRCKLSLWLGYKATCDQKSLFNALFSFVSEVVLSFYHAPDVKTPIRIISPGMALPFMKIIIIILLSLCSRVSGGLKIAGIILLVREVTVSGAPGWHYVILHIIIISWMYCLYPSDLRSPFYSFCSRNESSIDVSSSWQQPVALHNA